MNQRPSTLIFSFPFYPFFLCLFYWDSLLTLMNYCNYFEKINRVYHSRLRREGGRERSCFLFLRRVKSA